MIKTEGHKSPTHIEMLISAMSLFKISTFDGDPDMVTSLLVGAHSIRFSVQIKTA